ncbi:hypothetical protein Micbo1qcDRAFT_181335 [Microdochium bolleyi]|uniref:Uncharacterized protein n=1 Tax=Microdochium bolleyi TaxID=196109 RepID=A0A136IIT1_9PEZI|nr:hypothetical protein Micbo1qcDRAFT_181335 [Microdochium bolleyi]
MLILMKAGPSRFETIYTTGDFSSRSVLTRVWCPALKGSCSASTSMAQTGSEHPKGRIAIINESGSGPSFLEYLVKAVADPKLDSNIDEDTRTEKQSAECFLYTITKNEYRRTQGETWGRLPHNNEIVEVLGPTHNIDRILGSGGSFRTVVLLLYDTTRPPTPTSTRAVERWEKLNKGSPDEVSSTSAILVSTFSDISLETGKGVPELIAKAYGLLGVKCPGIAMQLGRDAPEEKESLHAEPDEKLRPESLPAEPPKEDAQTEDVRLEHLCSEKVRLKQPSRNWAIPDCCGRCPLAIACRNLVDTWRVRINRWRARLASLSRRDCPRAGRRSAKWHESMEPLLKKERAVES